MKRTLIILITLALIQPSFAATTTIDFETLNSGYTASGTEGSTAIDVFNRVNPNVGGNSTYIWAVEDISLIDPTITLDQIDITGATNFTFSIDLVARHFDDWDNNDELQITYSVDGGSYTNLMWVENTGQQYNDPAALDTDFDGDGECGYVLPALTTGTGTDGCVVSSSSFATFTTSEISLSSNSTLDIILSFKGLTAADEGIYLDDIVIATSSSSVDNPGSFSASESSSSQIDLTWTQNGNTDNVMVAWNSANTFGVPSGAYSVSDPVTGGGTVIYNGSGTSYNHTPLSSNTAYYYKAWSVDGSTNYSSGVTTNATTLKTEPSNHVTSFASAANGHAQIDLSWSDNNGASAADGQLVLINRTGTFSDPVDGTAQSNDLDLSDNSGVYNASSGVEAYSWTGLDAETQYYFKIFPYTNSGTDIDYKIDGTVPISNATTEAVPAATLVITEINDPSAYQFSYIEIYNTTSSPIDIQGYSIVQYNSSTTTTFNSANSDLTISKRDGTSITTSGTINIPGKGFLLLVRGSSSEASVAIFEGASYYNRTLDDEVLFAWDGTDAAGVPLINGSESFELKNASSLVIDKTSSGTDSQINVEGSLGTFSNDKRYERIDVSSYNWKQYTGDYSNATPGQISSDNQTDSSLPVVLSAWKATSSQGLVKLLWTTDSEIENQGFIIERTLRTSSFDGAQDDKTPWKEIASFATNDDLLGQGSTSAQNEYFFIDKQVKVGKTYSYRLSDVDYRGNITRHAEIKVTVKDAGADLKPSDVKLHNAFPNPFNPDVNLSFTLENEVAELSLEIYDIQGALVQTLSSGYHEIGNHDFKWNGFDTNDNAVSSGVYMVRLSAGSVVQIQRVTLLR